MKVVGIVCEYNPFHTGHGRQIEILRQNGAEVIICAMSGNFSQRGELTVADKYTRAESAVKCGADIVIELPFPYSSLSAEGFCRAGVHLLASLGCDTISFGSESADLPLLNRAADVLLDEDFVKSYTETSKTSGSAKSFFELLNAHLGEKTALLSNDILAISYIAAIKRQGLKMDVFPIKREGAAFNENALTGRFPSATAVRRTVKDSPEGFAALPDRYLPTPCLETLVTAQKSGTAPVFIDEIGSDILSFFKLLSPDEIVARAIKKSGGGVHVACDGCGIVERLCNCAKRSSSLDELLAGAYNSRYTDARINRVILFSMIGVSDIFEASLPDFTNLLAASDRGRKHLSEIRKTVDFPIVTKPADAPEGRGTDILRLSDSLYSSAMPKGATFDHFLKKHPYMG